MRVREPRPRASRNSYGRTSGAPDKRRMPWTPDTTANYPDDIDQVALKYASANFIVGHESAYARLRRSRSDVSRRGAADDPGEPVDELLAACTAGVERVGNAQPTVLRARREKGAEVRRAAVGDELGHLRLEVEQGRLERCCVHRCRSLGDGAGAVVRRVAVLGKDREVLRRLDDAEAASRVRLREVLRMVEKV